MLNVNHANLVIDTGAVVNISFYVSHANLVIDTGAVVNNMFNVNHVTWK